MSMNCLSYLKKYKKEMIIGPLFKLFEAILELAIPFLMGRIIDHSIPEKNLREVWILGAIILLFGVVGLLFSLTCQYFASKAANGFGRDLRKAMFAHIHTLSYQEIDQVGSNYLVTIMTTDINQLQNTINRMIRLVMRAPFILVGSVICAFIMNVTMGWIMLAVVPILALILFLLMRPASKKYLSVQRKLDHLSLLTDENLSGARVVRAFQKEEDACIQYETETKAYQKLALHIQRFTSLLNPLTYTVIQLAIIAILYFGGHEVQQGLLSQGDIIALVNYMNQILLALLVVSDLVILFTKATASYTRCNVILRFKSSIQSGAVQNVKKENVPYYSFQNVSFSYPKSENEALEQIQFSFYHGETVGMIGGTGSGKSTILALMERFYDASHGTILVDGIPITSLDLSYLRKQIAIVDQKTVLFKGTIRSNLQMAASHATDEEMWRAIHIAEANFVDQYAEGLDYIVEEGGKNFSGGQRQRLAIARAVIQNPQLLILDDATSALDFLTDLKVRKNIRQELKNTTLLFISQRSSSIRHADRIFVIDTGMIVGNDTHENLLQNCEVYREICASQAKKEGECA